MYCRLGSGGRQAGVRWGVDGRSKVVSRVMVVGQGIIGRVGKVVHHFELWCKHVSKINCTHCAVPLLLQVLTQSYYPNRVSTNNTYENISKLQLETKVSRHTLTLTLQLLVTC